MTDKNESKRKKKELKKKIKNKKYRKKKIVEKKNDEKKTRSRSRNNSFFFIYLHQTELEQHQQRIPEWLFFKNDNFVFFLTLLLLCCFELLTALELTYLTGGMVLCLSNFSPFNTFGYK